MTRTIAASSSPLFRTPALALGAFVAMILLLASASARAAPYGGIALGRASIDTGARPVPTTGSFFGPPTTLPVDSMSIDEHDTAYAAFAGVQLTRYFGAEAGYWNHGTFQSRTTSADTGQLDIEEIYLGATLRYPFAKRFALIGGIGVSRASFAVRGAGTARIPPGSAAPIVLPVPVPDSLNVVYATPDDETGHYWNAGVTLQLAGTLEASVSYGIRDLKVERVKLPSIALIYAF